MTKFNFIFTFSFLFFSNFLFSQSDSLLSQEAISNNLENYFKLERETIYLNLNKSCYLTTEDIWFKGYIVEKKTKAPFFNTSNVYLSLYDETGKLIKTQLFYAENSTFDGSLKLDNSFKTGKYFIQVYTNFMNNFLENESSVFEFKILNPEEKNFIDDKKINYNDITVSFYPESGTFLQNSSNSVVVKIQDCSGIGIPIKDIEVVDSNNNVITTFSTDKIGYGRVTINPIKNESYKTVFTINDTKHENSFPASDTQGIVLSVNNYGSKDKTIVNIKTNANSVDLLKDKSNILIIQQNENALVIPITFKANEYNQSLTISNDQLLDGINVFTILNSNKKKLGERIIYNPSKKPNYSEITVKQVLQDSIIISGKSNLLKGNISISVVPSESEINLNSTSILNTFLMDNYLEKPSKNMFYYLSDFSRAKHFELDNYLLTQISKYQPEKYLNSAPEKKFAFENGLTLKGTLNNEITESTENYKVNINSLYLGLNENVSINNKKEFLFENVLAIDSASIYFTLYNKKSKPIGLNVYCQILNNKQKFNNPFIANQKFCSQKTNLELDDFIFPKIKNQIILDEVSVKSKKKEELTNNNKFSNGASRGYKISDDVAESFRDVLSFIRSHGYNVTDTGTDIIISRTYTTTITGSNSPLIFLDDTPLEPLSLLRNMNLNTVDEIYINKIGYGGGLGASNGVIRIYSKMPNGNNFSSIKIKSKPYIVTAGFEKTSKYKNPEFLNTYDSAFQKFGTIHWIPSTNTDENGDFKFSIPNLQQKTIKIIIEGISSDGELLSEIKTINLN